MTEGARAYRRARARDLEALERTLTTSERTRSPRALRAPGLTPPSVTRAAHDTHQPPGAAWRGEELRWAVYNEITARRFQRSDQEWAPALRSPARRLQQLRSWPKDAPLPRWRLIEAWTIAAHGPHMAVAGRFRLAFWSEHAEHYGPRLERALARYVRCAEARPPGWPPGAIAALATFLASTMPRQARDGLRRRPL